VASANAQSLPFQVRVLDGPLSVQLLQQLQPAGVVQLEGRSGPYRPISFSQTMRVKTTWYPGNPEGTQQVLGLTFAPTTITGMWKDRYLGDGQARALVDLFERLQSAGSSLEVSWGTGLGDDGALGGRAYVRVGVLRDFRSSPDRPQDVAWEMTFEWRGRGEAFLPAVTGTPEVAPREGFQDALGQLGYVSALYQTYEEILTFGIPQEVRDGVAAALTDIDSATDGIKRVTSVITTTANFLPGSEQALIASVRLAQGALAALLDEAASLDPSSLLLPSDDPIDFLVAKDQDHDLIGGTRDASEAVRRAAAGMDVVGSPEVIAEVRAPAGVDLRDLALRFYGDPDAWWAIADFNGLPDSSVPAPPTGPADFLPAPIRIPRLQVGPNSDLRQNC
jgi:hypothetical protein